MSGAPQRGDHSHGKHRGGHTKPMTDKEKRRRRRLQRGKLVQPVSNPPERMVVLDDGETWTSNGRVIILKSGMKIPDDLGDADHLADELIDKSIEINDLLEAYNQVHGTKY